MKKCHGKSLINLAGLFVLSQALLIILAGCSVFPKNQSGGRPGISQSSAAQKAGTSLNQGAGPTIAPNQAAAETLLATMYASWKSVYVTSAGCPVGLRVCRPGNNNDTVSEGIGYGMLLSAYIGDKATFDGLWAYEQYYKDTTTSVLMNWNISSAETMIGAGSASDADEDMALAMVMAFERWGGTYGSSATALITAIYTYDVNSTTGAMGPGDTWGNGNYYYNPSYFALAWYRVFGLFTGNTTQWNNVASACYAILNQVENSSTGLVPDWCADQGGTAVPCTTAQIAWDVYPMDYYWDACRTPWRISLDSIWFANATAQAFCNTISSWAQANVPSGDILCGYQLNGTVISGINYGNAAFSGAVADATIGTTAAAGITAAYKTTIYNFFTSYTIGAGDVQGYFGDTLEVVYLLTAIGEFPDPLPTVYACGYSPGANGIGNGCFWTIAPTGTTTTSLGGSPNSIFVYGGTVYTCGVDSSLGACYWSGTTKIALPNGAWPAQAYSIFVADGTVYVAGYDSGSKACYWSGTSAGMTEIVLSGVSANGHWGQARSIFVDSGGTVYTSGFDSSGNACYWTGTSETVLAQCTDPLSWAIYCANSIFVYNGTVYTAGFVGPAGYGYGCYWINGSQTPLGTAGSGVDTRTIFVDNNGNCYVGGLDTAGNACYWTITSTGPVETPMGNNASYSPMISMYALNGTVYSAGESVLYGPSGAVNACYWVGANQKIIQSGAATGIFVAP